jgi:hypothetical protein
MTERRCASHEKQIAQHANDACIPVGFSAHWDRSEWIALKKISLSLLDI